ncbi:MAG: hypothetical protein GC182_02945 [Rhodopseudomonas sp.]|nr:hypothetical protein [Rhodopseudomonas sp.]
MNDSIEMMDGRLRMIWKAIGPVGLDISGKLEFPNVSAVAGLYRFCIARSDLKKSVYVGETDNIQRRFAHYRNPGPSQMTNLRLNSLFKAALSTGGSIEVSIVTDSAWIVGMNLMTANFREKSVRRLFENFSLVFGELIHVEQLNK